MKTRRDAGHRLPIVPDADRLGAAHISQIILLVDGGSRHRGELRDTLESLGHTVFEAASARQAHVILGHMHPSPDLVLASPDLALALAEDPRVPRLTAIPSDRDLTRKQLAARLSAALDLHAPATTVERTTRA